MGEATVRRGTEIPTRQVADGFEERLPQRHQTRVDELLQRVTLPGTPVMETMTTSTPLTTRWALNTKRVLIIARAPTTRRPLTTVEENKETRLTNRTLHLTTTMDLTGAVPDAAVPENVPAALP